eukprot:SRR837773.14788.p1 GENE.SRR837773.14788~~SRR837773.14788.p1  ORF type:complete len:243 (-),score=38.05 SRR837773.14788:28-672(-)
MFLLLSFVTGAVATTLRGAPQPQHILAASNASRTRRARAILPQECDHCQSGGIVDPFSSQREYCQENYDSCKCCQKALEGVKSEICLRGNGGSSFMGHGSCVAGIQAAMEQKQARCAHQRAVSDYNMDQARQQINDALGDRSPYYNGFVAVGGTRGYVAKRYSSECASYSDPNCADWAGALCQHDFGCNDQLQKVESDLDTIKSYYGLFQNIPC